MDYGAEYLDPDEEFEMMYADEMELMDEIMYGDENETGPRKSLNFGNTPKTSTTSTPKTNTISTPKNKELRPSLPSTSQNFTPNYEDLPSTSSGIYHVEDLLPPVSKTVPVDTVSQTPKLNGYVAPSESPSPLIDLEDSLKNLGNAKIVVNQNRLDISANKRTADDLFGDIDDIDFNEDFDAAIFGASQKRQRLNGSNHCEIEDKDAIMIARIQAERKKRATNITTQSHSNENPLNKKTECTLVRRVPKWNFMTLRNGKGEKFYAKLHSDEVLNTKITSISEQCKNIRLLNIPFQDVMNEANTIIAKKLDDEMNTSPNTVNSVNSIVHISKSSDSDLWVEKYKPMSYIDLLSDEGTNRILLQWVMLWDKVVFGREKKVKMKENKSKNFESRFQKRNTLVLDEELDDSGCPKHKLVLLCGPPGLGKTTLAHVVAKHAGYNPVEMNASDDRSPDIFRQQLEAATQMRAVIGASPRPNCLIIDEIDGAPSASIDVLVKFAKGECKKVTKKKAAKLSGVLKRPIICICNDVYVPALRSLRQMAFVIHFPPTPLRRLTQRLVDIARREKIQTDSSAMMALCEKANNDIRTCLSTIYCLKDKPIKLNTVSQAQIGSKDMQKGLFTVWQEVFQIQSDVKLNVTELKRDGYKTETDLVLSRRLNSVLRSVQGNGDYDRLAQGIYENFLNVKLKNFSMNNISKSLQWFCFFDQIKTTIAVTQTYTLMTYLPYCFVMWHFMFSNYLRPKLTYPSLMYELMTKQSKYQQTVQEILKGMDPKIRAYSHYEQLLLDNLPYFSTMLNPNIRPVSVQLFSNAEKAALCQLVNTMIDYNLNFVQERTQDGSYEFIIDPNMDEVVEFPNITKSKRLTYSLKMTISREIEQEKLKRLETSILKNSPGTENLTNNVENLPMDVEEIPLENSSQEKKKKQNHLQKLTPKAIKKLTPSQTRDFFGRIVEKPVSECNDVVKVDEIVKSDVWYHFKEGYSNAVRRSVYMKDLLQI